MKTFKKQLISALASLSLCANVLPINAMAAAANFTDVQKDAYYANAVDWAVTNNIATGVGNSNFAPAMPCTRAQTVTFIWRSKGSPKTTGQNSFTDVNENSYYYDAVSWAAQNGITSGTSATEFSPEKIVTRAQVVCFLHRADGLGNSNKSSNTRFLDVPQNAYFADSVSWAAEKGITSGTTANTFAPDTPCTRGQIVTFLYRSSNNSTDDKIVGTLDKTEQKPVAEPEKPVVKPVEKIPEQEKKPEKEPVKPVQPETKPEETTSEPDTEGAKAAIQKALEDMTRQITKFEKYHMPPDQCLKLANDLADIDGENNYGVNSIDLYKENGITTAVNIWYKYATPHDRESLIATEREEKKQDQEMEPIIQNILSTVITDGMTDYDKIKALHDYIALNCAYDISQSQPYIHSPYGVIVKKLAVCEGYAEAYKLLLERCGIECKIIYGTAAENHEWNAVLLDGEWYAVDVTWDDPVPTLKDGVIYTYFLKSDSAMGGHSSSGICNSTKYDNLVEYSPEGTKFINRFIEELNKLPKYTDEEIKTLDSSELNKTFDILLSSSAKLTEDELRTIAKDNSDYNISNFYSSFDSYRIIVYNRKASEEAARRISEEANQEGTEKPSTENETQSTETPANDGTSTDQAGGSSDNKTQSTEQNEQTEQTGTSKQTDDTVVNNE